MQIFSLFHSTRETPPFAFAEEEWVSQCVFPINARCWLIRSSLLLSPRDFNPPTWWVWRLSRWKREIGDFSLYPQQCCCWWCARAWTLNLTLCLSALSRPSRREIVIWIFLQRHRACIHLSHWTISSRFDLEFLRAIRSHTLFVRIRVSSFPSHFLHHHRRHEPVRMAIKFRVLEFSLLLGWACRHRRL